MKKLLKIKSISDVITNSSTEVFVIKMDEKFNEIKNSLRCYKDFEFFENEEYVKNFIIEHIKNNTLYELEDLFTCKIDFGNFSGWEFFNLIEYCRDNLEKTPEEIYEFFKSVFNQLIGYAWVEEEDNWSTDIIDELRHYGYSCTERC